jgi:hypothetical protein
MSLIMEMLTGDEIQAAVVKAALVKQGIKATDHEAFLKSKTIAVSYRSMRFPDGTSQLFASVGIVSKEPEGRAASDTPIPVEKADG